MDDKTISICIGNWAAYNAGYLIDRWIDLPLPDEKLQQILEEIQAEGRRVSGEYSAEECYISDREIALDGLEDNLEFGLRSYIDEYSSIEDVNLLAKQLYCMDDDEIYKADLWAGQDNSHSLDELLNICLQTEDIPFFSYDSAMDYDLSNEEKFGYHVIEDLYPEANRMLNNTNAWDIALINCFDAQQLGMSIEQSGYVKLYDNGYIQCDLSGPDTSLYSSEELKEIINRNYDIELNRKPIFYPHGDTPDGPPMMEMQMVMTKDGPIAVGVPTNTSSQSSYRPPAKQFIEPPTVYEDAHKPTIAGDMRAINNKTKGGR